MVGAGFIGVEWSIEMKYFFPELKLTIIDFLPKCLGPLPDSAAEYCSEYMHVASIKEVYNCKYDLENPEFWKEIELPIKAVEMYVCIGVKTSNYFMPKEVLSEKGPGGGGAAEALWPAAPSLACCFGEVSCRGPACAAAGH